MPKVDISLRTSVSRQLPALYTCDGANMTLPLSWGKVPPHTAELDLFVVNLEDVKNNLFVDWGVAGLKPSTHELSGGQLPSGAVVARNAFGKIGYSICPPKGKGENFVILLDALKKRMPVKRGFNPTLLISQLLHTEVSEGILTLSYTRQ